MKIKEYIKNFETHKDYNDYLVSYDYVIPNVSTDNDEGHVHYSKKFSSQYLTFVPRENMKVQLNYAMNTYNIPPTPITSLSGDAYYSIDGGENWTLVERGQWIDVPYGTKCLFKGNLQSHSIYGLGIFNTEGDCDVEGNICSMAHMDDFNNITYEQANYTRLFSGCTIVSAANLETGIKNWGVFHSLFSHCEKLVAPPHLEKLTRKPTGSSFYSMFYGCKSLVEPPSITNFDELVLKSSMFRGMFENCTSLTATPEFNFTANPSYRQDGGAMAYMFAGCKSLVKVHDINIDKIGEEVCMGMFSGCTSLKVAPKINISTGKVDFYGMFTMFKDCTSLEVAPDLSNITELGGDGFEKMFMGCESLENPPLFPQMERINSETCKGMFSGCVNLKSAPDLSHVTSVGLRGMQEMFAGCTSLTTAPELPATKVSQYAYREMFSGCTNLETAPSVLPATELKADNNSASVQVYKGMFKYCTKLTKAPVIEAEITINSGRTAVEECFSEMFYGCYALNEIRVKFKSDVDTTKNQLNNWVLGVSNNGTFYLPSDTQWQWRGGQSASRVPIGWTVIEE